MNKLKPLNPKNITSNIIFALSGLIGFFVIFLITNKWGIGLSPDSAGYLAAAENINNGKGISLLYDSSGNPLRTWLPWRDNETLHLFPWPPFFPLVLSIFGFIKLNLIEAARFLNAAILGANVFLVIFLIKKYLKSIPLMIFAAVVLISSKDMIQLHSVLWSEPLYIFLSLLGFVFLFGFLKNKKILFLLIASSFFSLAFITRTIGISLIPISAVAVLLFSGFKLKKKIIYSAISVFIGILPFSIWTLINNFTYGTAPAEFIFHPFQLNNYLRILDTISLWVMTTGTSEKVRIILLTILIIAVIIIASYIAFKNRKRQMDENYKINSKIIGIFLFYILFYLIALLSARYFYNNAINIGDVRMLGPILVLIFLVFLFFLKRLLNFFSNREYVKILVYLFCGFLIATSLYNTNAIELYKNGHASKIWDYSETIEELKKFKQAQNPIYANEPAVIYLFLGRSSIYLPMKHNIHTNRANPDYQEELDEIMEEIKEKDGLLVFFDGGWGVFPNEQETILDDDFYLFKDTADGAIYRIKK